MRITRRLVRLPVGLGFGLVLAAASPTASAQDALGPCSDDLARLCGNAGPTQASKRQCLNENLESLSDGCKSLLGEPQQRRTEAGEACGDDAVRLCAGVQPGRNNTGLLNCLRTNASSLTDECRNAIDALPGKKRDGAASGV
jgi:hypothetical protein